HASIVPNRFACVDRDPHPNWRLGRPRLPRNRQLNVACRSQRFAHSREDGKEAVALAMVVEDLTATRTNSLADKRIVALNALPHQPRLRLPQTGGCLDIRQEESHHPTRRPTPDT